MTMGIKIKQLRKELGLSQEELGQRLEPKVNRAAVNKWETGQVENIKRCHIEQMAVIFDVSPIDLMCFESKYDENKISNEVKVIETIQEEYGKDYVELIELYSKLNVVGKSKVMSYIEDICSIDSYCYRCVTDVTDDV